MRVIRPVFRSLVDDWHLPLAMVTAALALVGVFAYRAWQTASTDTKLCDVLVKIVADGDRSLDGISYYKTHPAELAQAHARNDSVIRELDCKNLPSG
jgi:predicted HAD superfamily Cof-like phosphohydrolase